MISAGCDLGSTTAKAVIMDNGIILSSAVIPARPDPRDSAREVLDACCKQAGIGHDRLSRIVGTGYGQQQIPGVARCESEITCHARGVFSQVPTARMIIDIGGQDSKVIKINEKGSVVQYGYNDKCAAGTGRFLEIMADALGVPLDKMGETGLTCREKLTISNQCVIFAETEVVSLINEDKDPADILNALFRAMAGRVASQARGIGIEADVVMTGGVAKNIGVFEALGKSLGTPVIPLSAVDPQMTGALGAALIAAEM